ncbi:MAG: efflux RND transporter permease subunit [Alphaproteobacteria bacterium]|nr:efflux RND transporter permease subunit [Alphaproteobacteria bacterium]
MKVKIYIPGANLPNINLSEKIDYTGRKFTVSFPSRPDKKLDAYVYEIFPAATDSEMHQVVLHFPQPQDFLVLPGMIAQILDELRRKVNDVRSSLPDGVSSVSIGDIAEVTCGYLEPATQILYHNGRPAIGIGVSITDGGNVVRLGEEY